ncbi:hypothetical protein CEUSTIGMA_g6162.t1 [Chlamydomonas eustigma]|uniref:Sphingomyelin phosphodiesterase 4 n=1 Tax=Chlamydomonas eustigma TaxID=1157962 RepID=A0A250X6K8_9CHLO|nr:hypothetical protein CEUSTIGMA_g6162.t1 [Chlamydomonas eustigma]|eukprot:GAX78724.1 hypothetical protein CEUSTIGMA_g6162.t1 [Chlamydomonas eustigma]
MSTDPFGSLNRVLDSRHTQPGAIRKACLSVEDCVLNNRDNLRGFFERCFPNLLKRIFGYDDFEASWLNLVTKAGKEEDAKAIVNLLHPQGKLFAAMHRADAESLIRYIFPVEQLPGHTQALLASATGRKQLESWPQYHKSIIGPERSSTRRTQIFLDVFTYFMFWTAFYVLRGNRSDEGNAGRPSTAFNRMSTTGLSSSQQQQHWGLPNMSELRRMGTELFTTGGHGHPDQGAPLMRHPYYTLLRLYLQFFLPNNRANGKSAPPASGGTADTNTSASPALNPSRQQQPSKLGNVILSILLEFWLTDISEPVPSDSNNNLSSSTGEVPTSVSGTSSTSPLTAGGPTTGYGLNVSRSLSYQPQSDDLVEALIQFARYVTVMDITTPLGGSLTASTVLRPAQSESSSSSSSSWLPLSPVMTMPPTPTSRLTSPLPPGVMLAGPSSSPAVQVVSRKLYRFLRRSFTLWPLPSSTSLTPTLFLWLSIIAPWTSRAQLNSWRPPAAPQSKPGPQDARGSRAVSDSSTRALHLESGNRQSESSAITMRRTPLFGHYSPQWKQHVLSHLPFYTILLPKFLELTCGRMRFRSDVAMTDALLVMEVLAASGPELISELKAVEGVHNSYLKSASRRPEGPYADIIAWTAEQAHDWEMAASAGSPPAPSGYSKVAPKGAAGRQSVDASYHFFTAEEHGAAAVAIAALRASEGQLVRPELCAALHDAAEALGLPIKEIAAARDESLEPQPVRDAVSYRQLPRAGNWRELRYHGDWLKRPVASNEVQFLVQPLVWASEKVNFWFGLRDPLAQDEAEDMPETLGMQLIIALRKRGFRFSLRILAEKQVIAWILFLMLVYCIFF